MSEQDLIRELAKLLDETGLGEIEVEREGLRVRVAGKGDPGLAGAPSILVKSMPQLAAPLSGRLFFAARLSSCTALTSSGRFTLRYNSSIFAWNSVSLSLRLTLRSWVSAFRSRIHCAITGLTLSAKASRRNSVSMRP